MQDVQSEVISFLSAHMRLFLLFPFNFVFPLLKQALKPPMCKGRYPEGAEGLSISDIDNPSVGLSGTQ